MNLESPKRLNILQRLVLVLAFGFVAGTSFYPPFYSVCKTQLGFPEVKLGILPGWGGTQRTTRIIGASNTAELACSGVGQGIATVLNAAKTERRPAAVNRADHLLNDVLLLLPACTHEPRRIRLRH